MAPIPHRINIVLCLFKRDGEKMFVDSSGPLKQSIDTTVAGILEATVHLGCRPLAPISMLFTSEEVFSRYLRDA